MLLLLTCPPYTGGNARIYLQMHLWTWNFTGGVKSPAGAETVTPGPLASTATGGLTEMVKNDDVDYVNMSTGRGMFWTCEVDRVPSLAEQCSRHQPSSRDTIYGRGLTEGPQSHYCRLIVLYETGMDYAL